MWMFCLSGFYSIVADRAEADIVLVRARACLDLERLVELHHIVGAAITFCASRDYPYRIRITRDEWARVARELSSAIDYTNFKGAVIKVAAGPLEAKIRGDAYDEVWSDLHQLEELNDQLI